MSLSRGMDDESGLAVCGMSLGNGSAEQDALEKWVYHAGWMTNPALLFAE